MHIKASRDQTVMDLLLNQFDTASKTRIRKLIQQGAITINDDPVTRGDQWIKAGQSLSYEKKKSVQQHLQKREKRSPVPIYFEDDYLLVVEKPAGILTYGDRGTGGTSIYKKLSSYLSFDSKHKQNVYVVHRLDREVSGLVLFAKSAVIQEMLKSRWKKTRKLYHALVEGRVEKPSGTIRSWLKEGPDQIMRSASAEKDAKLAVTHYVVLNQFRHRTLLEVDIETGRKNQIRAQLSEMGHPVVGDRRYGAKEPIFRKIRLHAFYLSFTHPMTGEKLEFTSPMPDRFLVLKNQDEVSPSRRRR